MNQAEFDRGLSRRWLGLAVGSLILAGVLAILLVIARMPPFVYWVTDPLFFKRALVVHVDLALVVWFYAFLGCLFSLLPTRRSVRWLGTLGFAVSATGVFLLLLTIGITGAQPVLSNYVPVLDHPLFFTGLGLFGGGLTLNVLDGRILPSREAATGTFPIPAAVRPGLRAGAIAFVLAMVCFLGGVLTTSSDLPAQARFELALWGGGHVLQFASTAAMLCVWLVLVKVATGKDAIGRQGGGLLFGILVVPLLAAPLLVLNGTDTSLYREGFTSLMRWGIFPVVLVFLGLCVRSLKGSRAWGHPATVGFLVSAGLAVLGFVLGALIRGSNTMVPAHYHASIGAVTAAFMTVTFVLLAPLGLPLRDGILKRAARWQPVVFGVGQMVFAAGFGLAGMYGMARKTYGAEQAIRSTEEWVGLVVMGVGGLVAVAGGILFLTIVATAWRRRLKDSLQGRTEWATQNPKTSPRFKSC